MNIFMPHPPVWLHNKTVIISYYRIGHAIVLLVNSYLTRQSAAGHVISTVHSAIEFMGVASIRVLWSMINVVQSLSSRLLLIQWIVQTNTQLASHGNKGNAQPTHWTQFQREKDYAGGSSQLISDDFYGWKWEIVPHVGLAVMSYWRITCAQQGFENTRVYFLSPAFRGFTVPVGHKLTPHHGNLTFRWEFPCLVDPLTARSMGSFPTHPVWVDDLPPHRGALLLGVV